ncbi:MAG: MAPEG family protein [Gammaproteobacteria bacterium]|nr:MAPEG family protein [Gammaproteobacteria bacterium]
MLYAMFMLVILTTVIMVLTARVRIRSVQSGKVPQSYYRLMEGHDIPDFVAKTTRNFNNLFEVPTLFYAGGAVYLALDQTGQLPVISAWVFVAARVLHSIIHLSYNNVLHRLIIFAIGNLSVLVMWLGIVNAAG